MRPGFIGAFTPAITSEVTPPPSSAELQESFEYAGGWSGTIADPNYYLTYVINPTASLDESFEAAGNWPGT